MKHIKLLFFILLIFKGLLSFSNDINNQEAISLAVKFISEFNQKAYSESQVESVVEYSFNNYKTIYAVNFKNSGGFVLVSTISTLNPIIGYIPNQVFDTNAFMPEGFKILLKDYSRQIIEIKQKGLSATIKIEEKVSKKGNSNTIKGPGSSVSPLLTTIWSQGCYFNDSTPYDPSGPCQNAVTGCVATAMGQVINYYNFPPKGSGYHSYMSNYGTLTANFGATNYNWNLMADTIDANSPASSIAAVSQLLSQCGISVDMIYSAGSSGAYSENAVKAFTHFFNFDGSLKMLYRDNYTDSIWVQMVRDELDSLRPLYYDGTGSGGHAFVCDGYQSGDYFHFNWGWNGSYNGWFLLTNLNPAGMSFSSYNAAVFGLKPQISSGCQSTTKVLTETSGHLNDGSSYQDYLGNGNCSWLINPQNAVSLKIDFYTFNLAYGDTLYIYDGSNSNATLISKYFGTNLPSTIYTSGATAFISFKTDSALNSEGWSLSYQSEFCEGNSVLTALQGQISDGSGPNLYHNNTDCNWLIDPGISAPIKLYFNNFGTESGFDFLKIYDGANANATLLGSFDGQSLPPTITANSGQMFINFYSDGGVVDQGWTANYVVCAAISNPIAAEGTQFCPEDSVSLFANFTADSIIWLRNNAFYSSDSLIWTNEIGDYQYIAYRNGCDADTSQMINMSQFNVSSPKLGNDSFSCFLAPYYFLTNPYLPWDSNGFAFNSYLWSTGDTSKLLYLIDFVDFTSVDSTYQISIITHDDNGCKGNDTILVYVTVCEGIQENEFSNLEIFPNPAKDIINWQSDDYVKVNVKLYDLSGKVIKEEEGNGQFGEIIISTLESGTYILQIISEDKVFMKRIIKL
jgi:hypothetical protein